MGVPLLVPSMTTTTNATARGGRVRETGAAGTGAGREWR